jgi:hypothetical protein
LNPKYQNGIFHHSIFIFSLSAFSLFFLIVYLLPTELYGSTLPCDPANLTNCEDDKKSSSPSSSTVTGDDTQSDNAGTPLLLPDISPTDKDLGAPTTSTDLDISGIESGNDNNDDSGDDNTNRDSEEENDEDSGNNDEDESSGGGDNAPIPFP